MTNVVFALMVALTCTMNVFADIQTDGFDAPAPPSAKAWINWLWLIVFIVAIVVTALKNPRRTHLN